jgi:hypothetical protein
MKKLGIAVLLVMLLAGSAFAYFNVVKGSDESVTDIPLVGNNTTIYTHSFRTDNGEYTGVGYWLFSNSSTVNVTIQYEAGRKLPVTEGSADGNFTVPVGQADIGTLVTTESTWYQQGVSLAPFPYGRFKITGQGANANDTIVNMFINPVKPLRQ